ncbi:tetratricopeptide repeat protein [Candidatus Odyssella acanthamoebae]|uniref:tetratricopeptide repeat protein n=1 Tax=Candidatus Odyssella acanthamoebae TaxID=91604 RepID=UPI00068A3FA2|nr:tetratricopeptide repeat protein [Candidatus Paracaedibacter acanthamoebae]
MKQRHNSLLTLALSLLLGTRVCCVASQAMENPSSIDLANITSTSLSLKGRKIGGAEAQVLAKNTTLTSLNLDNNDIGAEGAHALLQGLRKHSNLIELKGVAFNERETAEVAALLAKNRTLAETRKVQAQLLDLFSEGLGADHPLSHLALSLAAIQGLGGPPSPLVAVRHLSQALKQGESRALPHLRTLAEQGHADAQYALAQSYEHGHGTLPQPLEALHWYRQAAAQGHSQALEHLVSDKEKAAQEGDRQAQYELAQAYYYGNGLPLNIDEGINWFKRAAENHHAPAQLFLARLYEKGEHVVQDSTQACEWYDKALQQGEEKALIGLKALAQNGSIEACYALGQAFEKGQGVAQDLLQARQWYEGATLQNHAPSLYALGALTEDGRDQSFNKAEEILALYQKAYTYYDQAQHLSHPQATFALWRVAQTRDSLKDIKTPELRRNLLLKKLQTALPASLSPDVLYKVAYLAEIIRLGFQEGPQEALFQALYDLGHFPRHSYQSRAVLDMLIHLINSEEFNADALDEQEDNFRLTALGRICRGIHLIKEPSSLIAPDQLPPRLRVASDGIRDVRVEVFNCLFKQDQATSHWPAFEQSIHRLLGYFDQGVIAGKITAEMLYDEEFDEHGTRKALEDLLRGGKVGRPSARFANRLIQIEPLILQLDEGTRFAQLSSWALAGLHCSTRAEKETYDFYVRYMSEGQNLDREELSLEMRIALSLADLRKQLISRLVPMDEVERLHQVAYLEKKAGPLLAVVGDAEAFQDRHEIIVKTVYKSLSPEDILKHVQAHYTVDSIANFLAETINRGTRLSYTHLAHAFEERKSSISLAEFYDEEITTFTPQGAKALLYSTGYLEREQIEDNLQDKIKLWNDLAQKGSQDALRNLITTAEQGHAEAQFNLGVMYEDGQGVTQDDAEAVKWYRKAADQGDADAQNNLGVCYYNGRGVPQDDTEAVKWVRLAADQGHVKAQNNLGVCYQSGQGVTKDNTEAVKWYRKAADQGHAAAQYILGICYYNGLGVTKDATEAVKWYRKAADQGNAGAQRMLGACYDIGQGVPKDEMEAVKCYRKAADQGHAAAQFSLGNCYQDGRGVTQDDAEAVNWFRKAADQGHAAAQFSLGNCYQDGRGVTKDNTEAVNWYRKAADQGHAAAQNELGNCYYYGRGVTQDDTEAVKWYRKAADQGNAAAQFSLRLL